MKIENLNDYRTWVRTVERIDNAPGAELRALEIWEEERGGKPVEKTNLQIHAKNHVADWRNIFIKKIHPRAKFPIFVKNGTYGPNVACRCPVIDKFSLKI